MSGLKGWNSDAMKLHFYLQNASQETYVPEKKLFKRWILQTLKNLPPIKKISLLLILRINHSPSGRRRKRSTKLHLPAKIWPTNIRSFPFDPLPGPKLSSEILGDLVICAPLVAQEANSQT